MKIWHVVKSEKLLRKMLSDGHIGLGWNIVDHKRYAHVTTGEPIDGYDLDAIGCNTKGRPVFQVLIEAPDDTVLRPDPADGDVYDNWFVSEEPIKILKVLEIYETYNPVGTIELY